MTKDRLYLLKPDFLDGGARQFCSECAMVEGMLSFYPQLRQAVDVQYVGFAKPRPEIAAELGPEHQSAPCLVVADPAKAARLAPHVRLQSSNGKAFVDDPFLVCDYLALTLGTGRPHK
jgi:hypothetical protein